MKAFKKHIALFYLVVFLFPIGMQTLHAFEEHHHTVCTSKVEKHFHQKEIDCSVYHFQFQLFNNDADAFQQLTKHFFKTKIENGYLSFVPFQYHSKKSSRAPPFCVRA